MGVNRTAHGSPRARIAVAACAALVCLWFAPAATSRAAEHIRIGAMNIAEFGEGNCPRNRDLVAIAGFFVDNAFDLIALQEVGVNRQAEERLEALVAIMNAAAPPGSPPYRAEATSQFGDERCAVIYRSPVVRDPQAPFWLDRPRDPTRPHGGGEVYYRAPVVLSFRAGDFDFRLVIVHLTWGDLDRRRNEVADLARFLRGFQDTERDWIVIGDMNRYGKHRKSDAKAFDQLLDAGWRDHYRFPLLEAVTRPHDMRVYKASRDEYSTTVAASRDLYDQIVITRGAYREFATDDPVFGRDVGIVAFDRHEPYASIKSHTALKYLISDHRPIWIRFRIDLGDDD